MFITLEMPLSYKVTRYATYVDGNTVALSRHVCTSSAIQTA